MTARKLETSLARRFLPDRSNALGLVCLILGLGALCLMPDPGLMAQQGIVREMGEHALPLGYGPVRMRRTGETAHLFAVLHDQAKEDGAGGGLLRIDVPFSSLDATGMTTVGQAMGRVTRADVVEARTGEPLTLASLKGRGFVEASSVRIMGTLASADD